MTIIRKKTSQGWRWQSYVDLFGVGCHEPHAR
jgi:hypothetical protein